KLVPDSLREAAYALGTPKWKMISAITLKASISGIMTGILLAIGIFVSHDREFVSSLATRVIEITPERVVDFSGNYDDYLRSKGIE
ncbi:ABC transporter permease subunit, partial [Salmonella enterica subsp. enterica serovar Kentucky]|nr:ABC transporter permease subunit [Salmonella enterica subsp. enterica serovar Kentucky]